ncbi:hypothetical protein H5410_049255 [Solanum commersonii]|uniref:Transposase-associated domain-containing protein n=1 Tax=Solanum commersonii TaxID=4109 RepID=A0A9J5XLT7_SOLCO|nr:hypothetical protein H5410_049255 [Solanum commersonii]
MHLMMNGFKPGYTVWTSHGEVESDTMFNKRYAALQAQLTFLLESGNILPPCPASSDGSDQEGDENDKSDKESEGDKE